MSLLHSPLYMDGIDILEILNQQSNFSGPIKSKLYSSPLNTKPRGCMREINEDEFNDFDDEGAQVVSGACRITFAKDQLVLKLNSIQTLESSKIEHLTIEIEKTFIFLKDMPLTDFCLQLWIHLLELKNEYMSEVLFSTELNIALEEIIYIARYFTKGGDSKGYIQ